MQDSEIYSLQELSTRIPELSSVEQWTYTRRCHGKVAALVVALYRMRCGSRFDQLKEMANRPDFWSGERLDREETNDDENRKGVEVVGEESTLISLKDHSIAWFLRRFDAADERVQHHANGQ